VQFVGYESSGPDADAALLVADDGDVERVPLAPGTDLAYTLGERRCAGVLTDDGHLDCGRDDAPYCAQHASTWVCAKCTGTCLKAEMDCLEPHAVYLAAFAPDTVKVGVTREWRLATRLREQGADRAAHLRTVENGRIAREQEAAITTEFTDRVRVPTKVRGLHRRVDDAVWADALAGFDPVATYDLDYGFSLDRQPVPATVATGTVVGVQGRVCCLERAGTTYAVDLRDLVGHEVTAEADGDALQSSFDAFA